MKVLLLSLALVAAAFAEAEVNPADAEIRAMLVNANVTDDAITEFFAANLNAIPFTPETYSVYKTWKLKWDADVPELEIRSNHLMMERVRVEVMHRTAELIKHLSERIPILEELAGENVEEGFAHEQEFNTKSSKFEKRLVERIYQEMLAAVEKEWALDIVEGGVEQSPESEDDKQKDEEKEEVKEETVEGEKEGEKEGEEEG